MTMIPIQIADPMLVERIAGRKVVFLDMNIWIDLAESPCPDATWAREALCDGVARRALFCPLSFSNINELLSQEFDSALRVGRLMQDLSLGVCFALRPEIWRGEIDSYAAAIVSARQPGLPIHMVFAPIMAYLGASAAIDSPPDTEVPVEQQDALAANVQNRLKAMSLLEYVEMLKDRLPLVVAAAETSLDLSAVRQRRFNLADKDREVMRRIEVEYLFQQHVIPRLSLIRRLLPLAMGQRLESYLASLPKGKYGDASDAVLDALPAHRAFVEVMAAAGHNPSRKGSIRDFYDLENLCVPLAYADLFVARDKWVKQILQEVSGFLGDRGVRTAVDLSQLKRRLIELQ